MFHNVVSEHTREVVQWRELRTPDPIQTYPPIFRLKAQAAQQQQVAATTLLLVAALVPLLGAAWPELQET